MSPSPDYTLTESQLKELETLLNRYTGYKDIPIKDFDDLRNRSFKLLAAIKKSKLHVTSGRLV